MTVGAPSRATSPLRGRMIFLVGARRSGTNWLQRILAAHPDVVAVPSETFLFSRGIAGLAQRFQHASVGSWQLGVLYMERASLLDALRGFCDAAFGSLLESLGHGESRLIERTPEHALHLDLIGSIYPDAAVVHIIRDGRDVVRSLLSMPWGPKSTEEAAGEWVESIRRARESAPGLALYREVRYEHLLSDPEHHIHGLYRWLGLDVTAEVLDAAITESQAWFNVDPAFPRIGTGKWKGGLTQDQLRDFEAVAGSLLEELGYRTTTPMARSDVASGRDGGGPPASDSPAVVSSAAVLVRRIKAATATARQRVRRWSPTSPGVAQGLLDRFLGHVVDGSFDEAAGLIAPTGLVRIVGPNLDWQGRGRHGADRLVQALAGDPAFAGRQVRSDVHPATPVFTVVTSWQLTDGATAERVFLVGVRDSALSRVVYYRLPLSG